MNSDSMFFKNNRSKIAANWQCGEYSIVNLGENLKNFRTFFYKKTNHSFEGSDDVDSCYTK
ncbi:MAG TPA: hypothetical protein DCF89_01820 [Flavobacteriales bacterium]|nr:hypothetical protein [Crocinitomicaceae bacterium]HAE29826.1 hypothetical protein [Flavobacteriales bacterium]